MLYKTNEIKMVLMNQFKVMSKTFYNELYVSPYSSTKANSPIIHHDVFVGLNKNNVAKFLMRSNPILVFDDELFKLTIGKFSGLFTLDMLQLLKAKDLYDLLTEKELQRDGNIRIDIIETSSKRDVFFKSIDKLVKEYCDDMNSMVDKIVKQKTKKSYSDQYVYLIECTDHESELVVDGFNIVASGNTWDFHEGSCGLSLYKKINLSGWNGSGSLASILSAGLKKKKIAFTVNAKEFELFQGDGYYSIEESPDYGEETIYSLIKNKKNNENQKFLNKFKDKVRNLKELHELMCYEYNKELFSIDEEENCLIVSEGHFVFDSEIDCDFEKFVNEKCKGWYIDFLYTDTLCLCKMN